MSRNNSATPTGNVTLSELGAILGTQATLAPTSTPGLASADVALTNFEPGAHTLTIAYYGDTRYRFGQTNVRMPEPKGRAPSATDVNYRPPRRSAAHR